IDELITATLENEARDRPVDKTVVIGAAGPGHVMKKVGHRERSYILRKHDIHVAEVGMKTSERLGAGGLCESCFGNHRQADDQEHQTEGFKKKAAGEGSDYGGGVNFGRRLLR